MMKNIVLVTIAMLAITLSLNAQDKARLALNFNPDKYQNKTVEYKGKKLNIRAFEKIVYVANPVDTAYQIMNIYIPEEYFEGKTINGYSAQTAPIFFPNEVGGYMPGRPASTSGGGFRPPINGMPAAQNQGSGMPPMGAGGPQPIGPGGAMGIKKENTVVAALARGYVVASAGARGRTNKNAAGQYYGKAPAGLVDLKAAVRYLKYNDNVMPGDANKIISNGTSAGGAMSALLGATGDNPDYLPYLKEIGAAETSDAIFASSDYCPIINLDNADIAYEWQFHGVNTYKKGGPFAGNNNSPSTLTDLQIKVSDDLSIQFPAYLNSLGLKDSNGNSLILDAQGNGSFKNYIKSVVVASANKAISEGADLSGNNWLSFTGGKVVDLDWDAYIKYMGRQKTPPAFDALDFSSPETNLFGTSTIENQHFTTYSFKNSTIANTSLADENIVKMMNPMNYIGTSNSKTAKYWRIRHGSKDKDTGLGISAILAVSLQNRGYQVDYALPWDKPHSGDYDLDELFKWVDGISK